MAKGQNKFHILTYGCQMNMYDSYLVSTLLKQRGFLEVKRPEEADLILVNTCAVREHAEKRVIGRIHSLGRFKKEKDVKIGVIGCMAKRMPELVEMKEIDFISGPDGYRKLVNELYKSNNKVIEGNPFELYTGIYAEQEGISSYLAISRGCNNFCSYCIVPYVRGPLRSRSPDDIIKEAEYLIETGKREIILLGQNVNEYDHKGFKFVDLVEEISHLSPSVWFNFLTSHPKDVDYKVFKIMEEMDNITKFIHLPMQSGSDRVLNSMNRDYTYEKYRKIIKNAREIVPDITVTTDLLVGFPGESKDDFKMTLDAVKEIEFDYAFMFMYSPRPKTLACMMDETLTDGEKKERLMQLIDIQNGITRKKNSEMIGKTFECLTVGNASKGGVLCKMINGKLAVTNDAIDVGEITKIKITGLNGWTPVGKIIKKEEEWVLL